MTVDEAYAILRGHSPIDVGKFYQSTANLGLGAGLLYGGIRYPLFNLDDQLFDTVEGLVFVLTHECDVDPKNVRPFGDYLVFCPIIPIKNFLEEHEEYFGGDDKLKSFLSNIAARNVSRLMFIPPVKGLEYGGLMYLNQICNTHTSAFVQEAAHVVGAVSGYGLRQLDQQLHNHLLRPKADLLADF